MKLTSYTLSKNPGYMYTYYIAITWSASLSYMYLPLLGRFGGAINALMAGPRKQPGPTTRTLDFDVDPCPRVRLFSEQFYRWGRD